MAYSETVVTGDKFRAIIEVDETPISPAEFDGNVPTLQVDSDGYGRTATPFNDSADGFEHAYNHFEQYAPRGTFERYLRIFHGTTVYAEYNVGITREYGYIGFDTAAWRDEVGAPVEGLKDEDILSEVESWASGDVWGVIVQKRVTWATEEDDMDDMDTWEEVEAVWGHYGQQYAEGTAREQYEAFAN